MKVLIPVDGSEASLNTIKAAANFLDKSTCRLYILTVEVPVAVEVSSAFSDNNATTINILDKAVLEANLRGFTVEKADFTTYYDPAHAICKYANQIKADLIVMGSHGYQGFTQFLMGSVSKIVFKEANQPVLVIRNDKSHSLEIHHMEKKAFANPKLK